MCIGRRTALFALSLLVLGGPGAGLASAGMITIFDSNKDPWKVTFPAGAVLMDTTPNQNLNNPIQTATVSLSYTFMNQPTSLVIEFDQQKASANAGGKFGNPEANAGLNFNLVATITNMQSVTWSDFEGLLIDQTPLPANLGTNGHPAIPHFHFTAAAPNQYNSNPLKYVAGDNGGATFTLGKGQVMPGQNLTFTAKIHEIVMKDKPRKFKLQLTPSVPEPSSLVLLTMGGACLAAHGWRYWKRRREQ